MIVARKPSLFVVERKATAHKAKAIVYSPVATRNRYRKAIKKAVRSILVSSSVAALVAVSITTDIYLVKCRVLY
jgi:hypothetical protein